MQLYDSRNFRDALGMFATGVTIITTVDEQGNPTGITATSFNSVSLTPPLVMWALGNERSSMRAFMNAEYYVIHVLGEHQTELSNQFAKSGTDKFNNIDFDRDANGLPMLNDFVARFKCKNVNQYAGGDHTIFVGEVESYDINDQPALLFHQGNYKKIQSSIA